MSDKSLSFIEGIKRQWVAMIDTLADPIILIDRQGKVVKTNRALVEMFGLQYKEIIGRSSEELFTNRNLPSPLSLVSRKDEGANKNNKISFSTDDEQHYEVSIEKFKDENGHHQGYVLLYNDISISKQLQAQLVQSEKMASIGLLAGGIAHEINNPLGGILLFSQMILKEMSPSQKHRQDVEEILNAAERCKAIVDNLLEFAHQSPAHTKRETTKTDPIEALETALRFACLGIKNQNIDVEWVKNADTSLVIADKNQLIQLFLNLMQNAIHAMPSGGLLTLKLDREQVNEIDHIVCEIKDTGVGIPAKFQKKIFDPFFTTKEPGEGTGLGLAICYRLVEDMGGKIKLQSTANLGTTFKIYIPAAEESGKKIA